MTALITRDELLAEIKAGTVTVVDALAGAIALVEADVDRLAPTLLPDRTAPIVTYCSNQACPNSQRVADRLTALGYTNVRKYAGGIEDWVSAGLPVE
jgi:rhodanese-related sulfurtransferase